MKQSVIISNKHGIYELPQITKLGNIRKISKLHRMPCLTTKMNILLILAKNQEMKIFLFYSGLEVSLWNLLQQTMWCVRPLYVCLKLVSAIFLKLIIHLI